MGALFLVACVAATSGLGASVQAQRVAAPMPSLEVATGWINSSGLTAESLRGKVVLVDFWTYSCINCLRTLPYVKAWAKKYRAAGLVVVGVHTPEFEFEQQASNVLRAVKDLGIGYPVALDSRYAIWRAFGNRAWPALYFVDAQGRIRHRQYGEGNYADAERLIQQLLKEAGRGDSVPTDLEAPRGESTQAAADAEGRGSVDAQRLYQLVRGTPTGPERTFEIEFLDPGVRAYAFTFG